MAGHDSACEKDFRDFPKSHDWSKYEGKNISIICPEDAIVLYMGIHAITGSPILEPFAGIIHLFLVDLQCVEDKLLVRAIAELNINEFVGKRVAKVKGCSKVPVPVLCLR